MKLLIWIVLVCYLATPQAPEQSLAEAARKEAERRRRLAEQEIDAKVIEARGSLQISNSNVTTFDRGTARINPSVPARETRGRISASTYRTRLRKLEREIRECEERLNLVRRKAEAEKWTLLRSGRRGGGTAALTSREQLLKQAEDLEIKLKRLRRERQETWDEARKAGFLPGELDGKALSP